MRIGAPRDFCTGLLFIAIGAIGLWIGKGYTFGSVLRMGPGYLPMVLAGGTVAIGIVVAFRSLIIEGPPISFGALRPVVMITAAVAAFGLLITSFGIIAATAAAVLVGSLATHEYRLKEVLLAAILMPAFCVVVFVWLLGQPIPIWPNW